MTYQQYSAGISVLSNTWGKQKRMMKQEIEILNDPTKKLGSINTCAKHNNRKIHRLFNQEMTQFWKVGQYLSLKGSFNKFQRVHIIQTFWEYSAIRIDVSNMELSLSLGKWKMMWGTVKFSVLPLNSFFESLILRTGCGWTEVAQIVNCSFRLNFNNCRSKPTQLATGTQCFLFLPL